MPRNYTASDAKVVGLQFVEGFPYHPSKRETWERHKFGGLTEIAHKVTMFSGI